MVDDWRRKPRLLRPSQVADYLGTSYSTIRRLAQDGVLEPVAYGKQVRYRLEDVQRLALRPDLRGKVVPTVTLEGWLEGLNRLGGNQEDDPLPVRLFLSIPEQAFLVHASFWHAPPFKDSGSGPVHTISRIVSDKGRVLYRVQVSKLSGNVDTVKNESVHAVLWWAADVLWEEVMGNSTYDPDYVDELREAVIEAHRQFVGADFKRWQEGV